MLFYLRLRIFKKTTLITIFLNIARLRIGDI